MLEDEVSKILNSNHTSFDTPQFRLLSDNKIEDIHNTIIEHVATEETVDHFRDYWEPRFFDRSQRESWKKAGSPSSNEGLNEKVKDIIENYEPENLSGQKVEEIMDIV